MSRELTDKEKQKIKKLVVSCCANYRKDYGCLPLGCDCYMFNLLINGMNEFRNMLLTNGINTEDVAGFPFFF